VSRARCLQSIISTRIGIDAVPDATASARRANSAIETPDVGSQPSRQPATRELPELRVLTLRVETDDDAQAAPGVEVAASQSSINGNARAGAFDRPLPSPYTLTDDGRTLMEWGHHRHTSTAQAHVDHRVSRPEEPSQRAGDRVASVAPCGGSVSRALRIVIDTGGTFTDVVAIDETTGRSSQPRYRRRHEPSVGRRDPHRGARQEHAPPEWRSPPRWWPQ
jgi:hypothetical protein